MPFNIAGVSSGTSGVLPSQSGNSGKILTTDGSNASWGNPALKLVETKTIAGAAVTQVSFTGLDLNTDKQYFLIGTLLNSSGAGSIYAVYVNADGVGANYRRIAVNGSGALATSDAASNPNITSVSLADAEEAYIDAYFKVSGSGYGHYRVRYAELGTAMASITDTMITHSANTTNITSIQIEANQANGIGIGSTFSLYKLGVA